MRVWPCLCKCASTGLRIFVKIRGESRNPWGRALNSNNLFENTNLKYKFSIFWSNIHKVKFPCHERRGYGRIECPDPSTVRLLEPPFSWIRVLLSLIHDTSWKHHFQTKSLQSHLMHTSLYESKRDNLAGMRSAQTLDRRAWNMCFMASNEQTRHISSFVKHVSSVQSFLVDLFLTKVSRKNSYHSQIPRDQLLYTYQSTVMFNEA